MKSLIKNTVKGAVAGITPLLWRLKARSLLVLMYHRVLPAGHPARLLEQPGMYVSPPTLDMHLGELAKHFTFMHLDDWLQSASSGAPLPARACAITFDDGWRDNHEFAHPVLRRAGVPATIFLVSDLVGGQYSFWPNGLARVLSQRNLSLRSAMPDWLARLVPESSAGGINAAQMDRIIVACKESCSDEQMLDLVARLDALAGKAAPARDLMDWSELRELAAGDLVRFGSHTRRHTRLSRVASADALHDEIVGSQDAIALQLGSRPRLFCYPNGDYSDSALETVRGAYLGAVTTQRGWHAVGMDAHLIRRIGVHEDISDRRSAFLARLSGWV